MFIDGFMEKFSNEPLKKFRLISGVMFFLFYGVLLFIIFLSKLDMMEYNRVWLSFDTKELIAYYDKMSQEGSFDYYILGHILDLFFVIIYTSFFISVTVLTKRTSSKEKLHWKIAHLFTVGLIIMPFIDWFETGILLASTAYYPNIPLWFLYAHVIGKTAVGIVFYPFIIWLVYLAIRAVIRKIKKV